jgi:hypothetical protein
MWAGVHRTAEEAGRDPGQLQQAVRVNAEPGETVEHIGERLASLAEEGVDEALVDFFFRHDTLDENLDAAYRVAELREKHGWKAHQHEE